MRLIRKTTLLKILKSALQASFFPSPYNTYAVKNSTRTNCVVDKNSVDAVLNAENNNYIYMCADPKRMGYHKFTDNDVEHAAECKSLSRLAQFKNITQ